MIYHEDTERLLSERKCFSVDLGRGRDIAIISFIFNVFSVALIPGPAGENLAWGSHPLSAERSVQMWYDEVKDCGPFPGCDSGATGVVGHFTALIWDGVNEIGCHANDHNLRACQYRGGDRLSCKTPNMMGSYKTNVFKAVRSRSAYDLLLLHFSILILSDHLIETL